MQIKKKKRKGEKGKRKKNDPTELKFNHLFFFFVFFSDDAFT